MKFTAISAVAAAAALIGMSSAHEQAVPSGLVRRQHSKFAHSLEKRAFSGKATWYGANPGDLGACGTALQPGDFYVALNQQQYGNLNAKSSYCFKTITITNGVKTAQAKILDACPEGEQCHWGALDMSRALFSYFNDFGVGVFDITWWVGSGSGPSSSGSSSSSSSSKNNDNDNDSSSSNNNDNNNNNDDDDSDKQQASRLAAKKADAAAAAKKQAAKAAQEKKDKEEEAEKEKKEKAKKKKEAAKKKKEAAEKAKKMKVAQKIHEAQSQNIAAFGEIMSTLNKMVESAQSNDSSSVEESNGSSAAVAAAASAGSSSSSSSSSSASSSKSA